MFSPAPMLRMSALLLQRDEVTILRALGELGVLQLERSDSLPEHPRLSAPEISEELARWDRVLAGIKTLREQLSLPPGPTPGPMAAMESAKAEERLRAMHAETDHLLADQKALSQRAADRAATLGQLSDFQGLGLPLEEPGTFEFLHFVTGTLPAAGMERLFREAADNVALLPQGEENGRQTLVAMTTRAGRLALEEALAKAGFEASMLPVEAGESADSLASQLAAEQTQSAIRLAQVGAELEKLAARLAPELAAMETRATTEQRLLAAREDLAHSSSTVLIEGWVPAAEAPALEQRMRQITSGCCVIDLPAPDRTMEDRVPVLLRHGPALRPLRGSCRCMACPPTANWSPRYSSPSATCSCSG